MMEKLEDYEDIEVLKKNKITALHRILQNAVNSKYKISLMKGLKLVLENFVLLILMISIMLKANAFSLIYLFFIFKYIVSEGKEMMLVRMTKYVSICLSL
jgi:hypothetical protein|tara:strand:- start:88 stop:387 length:300 start_codon:yes stop_codon:yes gene_type:complete